MTAFKVGIGGKINYQFFYSRLRQPNFHTPKYFRLPSNSMTPIMIGAMVTIHRDVVSGECNLKGSITKP